MSEGRAAHFLARIRAPRGAALVLPDQAASRSLAAIIAILTFLASLAAGGAEIVASASSEWRASVAREATIQLRPLSGRNMEADLVQAAATARATPGILDATPLSRSEAESLLEPWLGRGLDLSSLPVPRMVVLKLAPEGRPDLADLGRRIAAEIPGAILDDHGRWLSRISGAATAILAVALALILLILAGSGLAVAFATRGAMAGSREVVEVLNLVGADDSFVSGQFASRFLRLGFGAAAFGAAGAALAILLLGHLPGRNSSGTGTQAELEVLYGAFSLGPLGLALIAVVAIAVGILVGVVSGWTAKRFLRDLA